LLTDNLSDLREYISQVVEVLLQVEKCGETQGRLLASINENFETDSEFWANFSVEALDFGCASKLKESGRFLELLILNSDDKRASLFRQKSRDNPDLAKSDFEKFLPPLSASLSKKFFSTMKPKAIKIFCKHIITDILSADVTEDMSTFVKTVSADYKMSFDPEDLTPISGDNPHRFRVIFELVKNSAEKDDTILVNHVLIRCLEIVPSKLKEFSKKLDDDDLKKSLLNFCEVSQECVGAIDASELVVKKLSKEKELWQNFVRSCLKHGLKLKLPFVIRVLSKVCRKIYGPENSVEIGQIYDMVCGHSSFVDTLLSTSNKDVDVKLKESVLDLILTLIESKKSLIR